MANDDRIGCGIVFYNRFNEILLHLRDDKPGINDPGCWSVPGGEFEEGETEMQCVRREALEETGLELDDPQPIGWFTNTLLFSAALNRPAEDIILTEGQMLKWYRPEDALSLNLSPWFRPLVVALAGRARVNMAFGSASTPA